MSKQDILFDSNKSDMVIKEKANRKKLLREQIIFLCFFLPIALIVIIFLWSLGLDHEEGVWYAWFAFRIMPIIGFIVMHVFLIKVHLRIRHRNYDEIIIGKDFIDVKVFTGQDSIDKLLISMDQVDKLEIMYDSFLVINFTKVGKEELGVTYKGLWVSFEHFYTDRDFYRALQQTGKIKLTDKEIDDKIAKYNEIMGRYS